MKAERIQEIRAALEQAGGNRKLAAEMLGHDERYMYRLIKKINEIDKELLTECVKSNKQKQKAQDLNRIGNKAFREHARIENAVSEYAKELVGIFKNYTFSDLKNNKRIKSKNKSVVILHCTDQHLNERVSLPHNKYDWHVAAKRLKKLVERTKRVCKAEGITDLLIAFTGDLINSDRRLDELLANAGNRAKASVLAVNLYQQMLRDLRKDFNVTVASVCGNESRFGKDIGWESEIVSDSFDFTINEHLKLLFEKDKRVIFVQSDNPSECVVNVAGQNVLLVHGHSYQIKKDKQTSVQSMMGRWTARGVTINMVFWGHLHEASISDNYARGSSLVGPNDYSEGALGLLGRASQNLYIVHNTGGFDGLKIDLQNTDGVIGYDISEQLESYNTKSANKCKAADTIHRIVI